MDDVHNTNIHATHAHTRNSTCFLQVLAYVGDTGWVVGSEMEIKVTGRDPYLSDTQSEKNGKMGLPIYINANTNILYV